MDASSAFLQGRLKETVFMDSPEGFPGEFPLNTVWKLNRPINGLKQAPREWHKKDAAGRVRLSPHRQFEMELCTPVATPLPLQHLLTAPAVVRRRRLSTAAHMVFEPVFDAFEHRGSKQFLKQLTFQHPLITTEIAHGDNDEDMDDPARNQYTLLDFASVPPDAGHLSGSTFIAHNQWGFEGRFTLLHLASSLATWRRSHGCFGPARLMLFQDGMLRTQVGCLLLLGLLCGGRICVPLSPSPSLPRLLRPRQALQGRHASIRTHVVCLGLLGWLVGGWIGWGGWW
ncbi:unnamed protein product [Closterium sp. NIES-65]|nr:unnamed protein product [Closterium sp. NIES-65]